MGRLSLQDVPELVDTKKKGDGVLDSPDSGLPPSPSPSHWGLAAAGGGGSGGERAPVPGTLEPDAATTPAVPVSAPARAPSFPIQPAACSLGTASLAGPLRERRRRRHPPVGTAWPSRGARGGSAARAWPAGAGGWKIVIAWEAREPWERRAPAFCLWGGGPRGCQAAARPCSCPGPGWRGAWDTEKEPQPSLSCGPGTPGPSPPPVAPPKDRPPPGWSWGEGCVCFSSLIQRARGTGLWGPCSWCGRGPWRKVTPCASCLLVPAPSPVT